MKDTLVPDDAHERVVPALLDHMRSAAARNL